MAKQRIWEIQVEGNIGRNGKMQRISSGEIGEAVDKFINTTLNDPADEDVVATIRTRVVEDKK